MLRSVGGFHRPGPTCIFFSTYEEPPLARIRWPKNAASQCISMHLVKFNVCKDEDSYISILVGRSMGTTLTLLSKFDNTKQIKAASVLGTAFEYHEIFTYLSPLASISVYISTTLQRLIRWSRRFWTGGRHTPGSSFHGTTGQVPWPQ